MSRDDTAKEIVQGILLREARVLDERAWADWLALYHVDAVYWVPAWESEDRQITDPLRAVSLIYHPSRQGLEERVMRVRSRQSVTALPLPRTTHLISNIELEDAGPEQIRARAAWVVHFYQPRTTEQGMHHGRCAVTLRRQNDEWRIAQKTIHLMNDCVNAVLDFYLL
jgi:3-phenylpropionate/cinnamic acid dioxygenase small subunit